VSASASASASASGATEVEGRRRGERERAERTLCFALNRRNFVLPPRNGTENGEREREEREESRGEQSVRRCREVGQGERRERSSRALVRNGEVDDVD